MVTKLEIMKTQRCDNYSNLVLFAEMASHYSADITESETTSLENTDDITESEASVNRCHDSCG